MDKYKENLGCILKELTESMKVIEVLQAELQKYSPEKIDMCLTLFNMAQIIIEAQGKELDKVADQFFDDSAPI